MARNPAAHLGGGSVATLHYTRNLAYSQPLSEASYKNGSGHRCCGHGAEEHQPRADVFNFAHGVVPGGVQMIEYFLSDGIDHLGAQHKAGGEPDSNPLLCRELEPNAGDDCQHQAEQFQAKTTLLAPNNLQSAERVADAFVE